MKYYVYVLRHPVSNEAKYIGSTKSPKTRLLAHINRSNNAQLSKWIKGLHKDGLRPLMITLNEFDSQRKSRIEEILQIEKHISEGVILLNGKRTYTKKRLNNLITNKIDAKGVILFQAGKELKRQLFDYVKRKKKIDTDSTVSRELRAAAKKLVQSK